MKIRTYISDDLKQMISIWNEIVHEGIAFPQEDLLDEITGEQFFLCKVIAVWRWMKKTILLDCIFFTRIMSDDVDIYAMQVMQFRLLNEDSISVKSLSRTVCRKPKILDLKYCSSMRL